MARFSVVTISYNQAEFLERAILSVIRQEGVDLDYVVVDPGSTDGSREIIDKYRDRMTAAVLEPDKGGADGLNKGLAACTGEYFAFINADDELVPGALADAAAMFDKNPDVDAFCGDSWQIDANDRLIRRLVTSKRITRRLCARQSCVVVQQSAFFRTSSLRAINGFDETNRTSWDGDMFYRLAVAGGRFERVNRVWAKFRVHNTSITGSGKLTAQYLEDSCEIFEREFGKPKTRWQRFIGVATYWRETALDPRMFYWKVRNHLGLAHG